MPTLSNELIYVIGAAAAIWVLLKFLIIPSRTKALWAASADKLGSAAAALAGYRILCSMAGAAVVAGALAIGLVAFVSSQISNAGDAARVVAIRDQLEQIRESLAELSIAGWLIALAVLALIFFFIARSRSNKAWNGAANARRAAIEGSIKNLSAEETRQRLESRDSSAAEGVVSRVSGLEAENRSTLARAFSTPMVTLGEDKTPMSINDLEALATDLANASSEAEDPEERTRLSEISNVVRDQAKTLVQSTPLAIKTLGGGEKTYTIATAGEYLAATEDEITAAYRSALVEAEVGDHEAQGAFKSRKEPEMLREWIAAGASSEATVDTAAGLGRGAAFVGVVVLFLGFLGFGASASAPGLIERAKDAELTIIASQSSEEIVGASLSPEEVEDLDEADLASEEETEARLRTAFLNSAAQSIQGASVRMGAAAAADIRRQNFRMRAVSARRAILSASARPAAPPLDPGRTAQRIQVSSSSIAPHANIDALDDAFDRRMSDLRRNDTSWRRLRKWASTPASQRYVSDAMLRTMIGSSDFSSSHVFRSWAERASGDFATHAARNGAPKAGPVAASIDTSPELYSRRDRRIAGDFASEAPQRVDRRLSDFRSGRVDPGSLHRTGVGGSGRTPYEELFPSSTDNNRGSQAGRNSSSSRGSGGTRTASRSYGRVKFSGRVGGVVLGREADGGQGPDVRVFEFDLTNGGLVLSLTTADGENWTFGPVSPAIAHHALSYAADGRVVTSTLPQPQLGRNDGLEIDARRVAVHPAFEDTAFACAAIQVDRFVDGFMYDEGAGADGEAFATARSAVTLFGRLLPYASNLPSAEMSNYMSNGVSDYARACGAGGDCFPIDAYEKLGFNFGSADGYLNCVAQKGVEGCAFEASILSPRATYAVDSGVRETPYSLDPGFAFLSAPADAGPLWPLDFIVQAVPQTIDGSDVDVEENWEPWIFPRHEDALRQIVATGIERDLFASAVFFKMREFVILQRLFRNVLDGNMGVDFPIEDLIAMQEATAKFVTVRRNEKWNINNNIVQLLFERQSALADELSGAKAQANGACAGAIDQAIADANSGEWPRGKGVWSHLGLLDGACGDLSALNRARSIRDELREYDLIDEAVALPGVIGRPPYYCERSP